VVRKAVHEMVDRAIRLDGTCSGEHGVGLGKTEYLESELGVGTVGLMETIKRTRESLSIWSQDCQSGKEKEADRVIS
jgi:D-lactate dehydrogenase (cytochrome)